MICNYKKLIASGVTITISVKNQERQKQETLEDNQIILFFSVKDIGAGISPDYLPMLLNPLPRATVLQPEKMKLLPWS